MFLDKRHQLKLFSDYIAMHKYFATLVLLVSHMPGGDKFNK